MAAKLQAMGYEAYFYEPAAGGHGYGKDNKERAAFTALGYTLPQAEDRLVVASPSCLAEQDVGPAGPLTSGSSPTIL